MRKKVLVIVVAYNGMRWLERCLGSVSGAADIFVVDNDSTDGSADFVQAHFPSARLVHSADNLGFSAANNLGMEYAMKRGYDYVYLLNQDAWLEEGALDLLVAAAEAEPSFAVLSPLQMTPGYVSFDRQFGKLYKHSGSKGVGGAARGMDASAVSGGAVTSAVSGGAAVPVSRVMAAHWLVSVEAIRKIGLFNTELFPLYGQDDDWCNRARYHGYRVGIVPQARAVHDRASRTESKERIMDRNYRIGSLVRLCNINRPLWERFLFVCLFTVVKAVKYGSLMPFRHFASLCRQLPTVRTARRSASR